MNETQKLLLKIQERPQEVLGLLQDLANGFETAGCEGCGTVSVDEMNAVRRFLGWDELEGGDETESESNP